MYILFYDLFMLLVAYTCYIYHNCFVALFCLIIGQNLCIAVMCMLVKFHGQFVYILVRIEFPSNWALKEQVKENRPITIYNLNSSFKFIEPSLDSPKTL
jgi:hypothetical protein